jgi:hypothetical protein
MMGLLKRFSLAGDLGQLGIHLVFDRLGQGDVLQIAGIFIPGGAVSPFEKLGELLGFLAILLVHVHQDIGISSNRIGRAPRRIDDGDCQFIP